VVERADEIKGGGSKFMDALRDLKEKTRNWRIQGKREK
jgi:hypothetical protein